jgi:hypothetical protein
MSAEFGVERLAFGVWNNLELGIIVLDEFLTAPSASLAVLFPLKVFPVKRNNMKQVNTEKQK